MHYKERCNVASSADPKYNMLLRSFQYKVGNKEIHVENEVTNNKILKTCQLLPVFDLSCKA